MAIETVAQARDAIDAGQTWTGLYRRGGPVMTANIFTDMSYAAGIPVANYYAATPLVSAVLAGTDGINTGPGAAAGLTKYVRRVLLMPPAAIGIPCFEMIDVVLYYPFVDGDGGQQDLFNTVPIPRYSGKNCRIMVVSQGAGTAVVNAQIAYTNSDGVAGRVTTATLNLAAAPGSLCSSFSSGTAINKPSACFVPLAAGDGGVKSIERVEYLSPGGGIAAFVIVKPLLSVTGFEATGAPIEVDCLADNTFVLPILGDGAYLSFLARGTTGATPATIIGEVETIWG